MRTPCVAAAGALAVVVWTTEGCQVGAPRPTGEKAVEQTRVTKPQRVASLSIGTDEILCALVEPERIVALSKYAPDPEASYVAELARRISVFVERDPERILALRADLVLLARYTKAELRRAVEQTGTPTLVVEDFRSLADIEGNIRRIGRAVGEEARAEAVIANMRAKLAQARAALRSDRVGLRALYVAPPLVVAGRDTMGDVKLTAAGLRNAAADAGLTGNATLSAEALLKLDPDVIFVATGFASDAGFRERLLNDTQLAALSAVRRKRVIALPSRALRTVSHHTADAVLEIVQAVNALP
ncbi:MAG: ABC transporter substrate-binding protein [Chloracidobacterium sp.]|nr:ABC transporter substrate-binding protein [Chloracidobacterium sp.]MDW8217830.1 ABC transporter substrate-binding protein [Acidobacteriota bacterium]